MLKMLKFAGWMPPPTPQNFPFNFNIFKISWEMLKIPPLQPSKKPYKNRHFGTGLKKAPNCSQKRSLGFADELLSQKGASPQTFLTVISHLFLTPNAERNRVFFWMVGAQMVRAQPYIYIYIHTYMCRRVSQQDARSRYLTRLKGHILSFLDHKSRKKHAICPSICVFFLKDHPQITS